MKLAPLCQRVPDRTKLLVGRYEPLNWWWAVVEPDGYIAADGIVPSHAEALAVGLAALEQASVGRGETVEAPESLWRPIVEREMVRWKSTLDWLADR